MSNKEQKIKFRIRRFGIWHWHIYYIKSPFTSLVRHRWMIGLVVSKSLSALPYRHLNIIYINIIYLILEIGKVIFWSEGDATRNTGKFCGRKNSDSRSWGVFGSQFRNRLELLFSKQSYGQLGLSFEDIISNISSNCRSQSACCNSILLITFARRCNFNFLYVF